MMSFPKHKLIGIVFLAMLIGTMRNAHSEEPLVFISAFASGDDAAIHAFRLDSKAGQLKQVHRTTDIQNPFFMALSPNHQFLYSIHAEAFGGEEHEQVAAFEVEGRTGRLKLLNRVSALGSASCYLDVDATGKTVVVANYSTGSVASIPVRKDGTLGKASSFVKHSGSSVDPKRQNGPYAHCIVVSPDSRFAFAADLGLDQVLGYRLDAGTSKLSPNRQPFVRTPPGGGPRHLTFHPNGKWMYVINELKNSVTMFDYVADLGMLIEQQTISTLPEEFTGTTHCADLKITPNGRFLYGTNRGHDSIASYAIDDHGRLKLIGIEPSLGKGPQNLAITPDGGLLLCANMPGNNVTVFRLDPQSGGMKSVADPVTMPKPSCIMLMP